MNTFNYITEYLADFHPVLKKIMDIYRPVYEYNLYMKNKSSKDYIDYCIDLLFRFFGKEKRKPQKFKEKEEVIKEYNDMCEKKEKLRNFIFKSLNVADSKPQVVEISPEEKAKIIDKAHKLFNTLEDSYIAGILRCYQLRRYDRYIDLKGMNPRVNKEKFEDIIKMIMSFDTDTLDSMLTAVVNWVRQGNDSQVVKDQLAEAL